MNQQKCNTCPGCGKHCPAKNPDCGFGRRFFAEQNKATHKTCPGKAGRAVQR